MSGRPDQVLETLYLVNVDTHAMQGLLILVSFQEREAFYNENRFVARALYKQLPLAAARLLQVNEEYNNKAH